MTGAGASKRRGALVRRLHTLCKWDAKINTLGRDTCHAGVLNTPRHMVLGGKGTIAPRAYDLKLSAQFSGVHRDMTCSHCRILCALETRYMVSGGEARKRSSFDL